ncbi:MULTISPECIES: lipocalin family protein [unclassified Arcicella]|uniref:lipocalin family protein n=1 Tax=unclassified Arcicella TaxID=2644986 RepID=UPI002865B341|nr:MULTISPECIES: lipocalin family protein [unclassified Arcicella]MDR6563591.1 hypothetical protein [Arcicella sp. BE51]MDR6814271.1 hypothetical protein [Arcicella sp. BE140]MDR6825490.1 hypothetical protein [Arcicella sp. BE139]
MKNSHSLLILFLSIFLITSCKDKDEVVASSSLVVGKWKVSTLKGSVIALGTTENYNEDLSAENIVYEFKSDGTFTGTSQVDFTSDNNTVVATPINGTYVVSGSEITLNYTNPTTKKAVKEIYSVAVSGTKLTFGLTLDLLKKAYSNDPNSLAGLSLISALNLTIEMNKQ